MPALSTTVQHGSHTHTHATAAAVSSTVITSGVTWHSPAARSTAETHHSGIHHVHSAPSDTVIDHSSSMPTIVTSNVASGTVLAGSSSTSNVHVQTSVPTPATHPSQMIQTFVTILYTEWHKLSGHLENWDSNRDEDISKLLEILGNDEKIALNTIGELGEQSSHARSSCKHSLFNVLSCIYQDLEHTKQHLQEKSAAKVEKDRKELDDLAKQLPQYVDGTIKIAGSSSPSIAKASSSSMVTGGSAPFSTSAAPTGAASGSSVPLSPLSTAPSTTLVTSGSSTELGSVTPSKSSFASDVVSSSSSANVSTGATPSSSVPAKPVATSGAGSSSSTAIHKSKATTTAVATGLATHITSAGISKTT